MDVVCLGSATTDVFILLSKLQKFSYDKFSNQISFPLGEKVPLDEYKMTLGGNACNVAVGLSRLGLHTGLAADFGSDEFSKKIEKELIRENVNMGLITRSDNREDHFNIILAFEGERTILEEKTREINEANAGNLNPKLIYLTALSGDWWSIYEDALLKNPNSKFALNPGTRQIENDKEKLVKFLPRVEILFLNLTEAQKIIGDQSGDIKGVLEELSKLGAKTSVVTDGRNGSYSYSDGKTYKLGVISEGKPKERTGAGDAYSSGFLYGFLNGKSIQDSMKYGAINADSVIAEIGGQAGLMSKHSMEEKFNNEKFAASRL